MSLLKRLSPLLATLLLALPIACAPRPTPQPSVASLAEEGASPELTNRNVRFGFPAPAGTGREAYLIERPQYVLSYNARTRTPNWVCWNLRRDDIGKSKRGPFTIDPELPGNIAKVSSSAYDGSGFDRGHMCPAQDRSSSQADMDATFYMTNIIPQAPNCNQRAWERLEAYCRDLTHDHNHVLWICSGPAGVGGEGKEGHKDEIGKGRIDVTVPAKVWKVILVLPSETYKPTRASRTIGVIMPNDQSVDHDWAKFRVPIAEVEKLTGLSFWPAIPSETAKHLKEKLDEVKVDAPRQKKEIQ